ncbi:MAG: UbiD family decarboxylase [Candidatus Krumholzibacteria bacterium]|nr:UbiD family decarboxylase [Candidatus Krumholzibacteria bacterium]
MPFSDLQSYLHHLEAHKMLRRVRVEVDPELEITEIATRVVREEGPALLFERVKGSRFPLAINFMGSHRHIEMILGMHPEELGDNLARFLETINPPSPGAMWNARSYWPRLLATRPRRVGRAPCQEVTEDPDLDNLPIIKCWPQDGGRFITFPLVMTRDPLLGSTNLAIYRMHVYGKNQTGMHMQIQKGGGFHYHQAEKQGKPLELACVLGADPALMLAGIFPLPEGLEEVVFSGLIRGKRTRLTSAKTLDIDVPADAEFVLEGFVPPGERRMEGPFGDHLGHYSAAAPFPVFHIKTVTRKRKPIYPAAVVGKPPQEDRYMGEAAQLILKPFIKMIRPEIHDLWTFYETGFHNLLVAAVESRYTKEPIKTALGLFGEGQLGLSKVIVLVEPSVNVRSFPDVLRTIRRNYDPHDDFLLISRAPLDTLDFTSFKMHLGSKMVIDATGDGAEPVEPALGADPKDIVPSISKWRLLEDTLLAFQSQGDAGEALDTLVAARELSAVKIIAAVSHDVDIEDDVSLMWGIFTRFDPARDIRFTRTHLRGIKPLHEGVMGIDATFKTGYPEGLVMEQAVKDKVDKRWNQYWSQTA